MKRMWKTFLFGLTCAFFGVFATLAYMTSFPVARAQAEYGVVTKVEYENAGLALIDDVQDIEEKWMCAAGPVARMVATVIAKVTAVPAIPTLITEPPIETGTPTEVVTTPVPTTSTPVPTSTTPVPTATTPVPTSTTPAPTETPTIVPTTPVPTETPEPTKDNGNEGNGNGIDCPSNGHDKDNNCEEDPKHGNENDCTGIPGQPCKDKEKGKKP